MPADVVGALITYIGNELDIFVTDGEVARYDLQGRPINPESVVVEPANWPAVRIVMVEPGFTRTWTMGTDPYKDRGDILVQVLGTGRAQVKPVQDAVEALLAKVTNWAGVELGGDVNNPNYAIKILMTTWWLGQEEGIRLAKGQPLYRGDLVYDVEVHGVISTQ